MIPTIFFIVLAISVLICLGARRGLRNASMSEHLVGGRSFPAWLLYFLAVGEIYSIGTMIGLPSGLYAGGASYGVWFIGYILMAYPLGYFIAPLVWRSGYRYDAMTVPDVFRRHFSSRSLEIISALALLAALIPWGQYQFIGMQVVLQSLGLQFTAWQSVLLAAVIAFIYLIVSGVRSPAYVSLLKDSLMLLSLVVIGVASASRAGGVSKAFEPGSVPKSMVTLSGQPMVFAITTIIFQSVVFYLGFSAAYLFTAKSERAIKQSVVWMPIYMLMYPFLVVASLYAVVALPGLKNPNTVFMQVTRDLLPDWMVGVVAGGAGLSGILVLAVTALTIGGIVTRNLVPNVRPERQRSISNLVVAAFLVLAGGLTLGASSIMLTVLNLTYYLLGQLVPGWVALMFFKRVQHWAVSTGIIVGIAVSLVLYETKPDFGGVNAGLVAVAVNFALVFGLSAWRPAAPKMPMAKWDPESGPEVAAENQESPEAAAEQPENAVPTR